MDKEKEVSGEWSPIFKDKMEELKISAPQLSVRAKVPFETLRSYLYKGVQPSGNNLIRICKILKIKV